MGYFQFLNSIIRFEINLVILKMIFVLEYQTSRTTFSNVIFRFIHVSENVSYFFESQLSYLARYQNIL